MYTKDGITLDECAANARLIAAAPDLLDALKACLDQLEYEPKRYAALLNRAYNVVAKAEGRKD